jgi:hypothetical protein
MFNYIIDQCCSKIKLKTLTRGEWFERRDRACLVLKVSELGVLVKEFGKKISITHRLDLDTLVTPLQLIEAKFKRRGRDALVRDCDENRDLATRASEIKVRKQVKELHAEILDFNTYLETRKNHACNHYPHSVFSHVRNEVSIIQQMFIKNLFGE